MPQLKHVFPGRGLRWPRGGLEAGLLVPKGQGEDLVCFGGHWATPWATYWGNQDLASRQGAALCLMLSLLYPGGSGKCFWSTQRKAPSLLAHAHVGVPRWVHVPVGWGAESGGMVPGKPFFQARFRMCSTWHVFDVSQMLKGRPAAPLSCLRVTWVSGSGTSTAA